MKKKYCQGNSQLKMAQKIQKQVSPLLLGLKDNMLVIAIRISDTTLNSLNCSRKGGGKETVYFHVSCIFKRLLTVPHEKLLTEGQDRVY